MDSDIILFFSGAVFSVILSWMTNLQIDAMKERRARQARKSKGRDRAKVYIIRSHRNMRWNSDSNEKVFAEQLKLDGKLTNDLLLYYPEVVKCITDIVDFSRQYRKQLDTTYSLTEYNIYIDKSQYRMIKLIDYGVLGVLYVKIRELVISCFAK